MATKRVSKKTPVRKAGPQRVTPRKTSTKTYQPDLESGGRDFKGPG